jgi:hypothetical protein
LNSDDFAGDSRFLEPDRRFHGDLVEHVSDEQYLS